MPENPKPNKQKLWLAVGGTLGVIIIIWLLLLPHSWNIISQRETKNIWPDLKLDAGQSFAQLNQTMQKLFSLNSSDTNANSDSNTANSNTVIISNPNNLSPEEIKTLEKDLFPEQTHE